MTCQMDSMKDKRTIEDKERGKLSEKTHRGVPYGSILGHMAHLKEMFYPQLQKNTTVRRK